MKLCLNAEPQKGNRKPQLKVRGKLESKTL